ncbi:Foie-gras_1 domain-containing protein [Meloidogyne graminicola]|uniref:Foie-gras_1 domain-containing protein n=1 Tax=Meloidogyne graminicola TaxID=189291 RepID=A0A8S9ZPU9_9BILA|nr:Foie-gras_1 domain-containing protein [Meloidogyne graminicola]
MEPKEIDSRLINNCLRGLIFFNGLDTSGRTPHHEAIFNSFIDLKRERSVQCQYKILNYEDNFFKKNNLKKSPPNDTLSIKNKSQGIIKRYWQYKYLDERPALIVLFVDLDWDSELWQQQKAECESRLNILRQCIGQLETKLALVLIQKAKTKVDDSIATEKAIEICQFCKISARQFYVFPLLNDSKATIECVVRLEFAFNQIAQEAYQSCFKKIRARSVPNNDQHLLLRQQFKLAFISELREDRHSSLRYYKQAYQIAADLDLPDNCFYELMNIAGFLNYKICELNFILNNPLEALNQFRKHSINFFNRQIGNYPSKDLANIEFEWWKSQQNRLFADLFNFAVSNGVAAYASQNPGRFLEESASHLKKANTLIRQIKAKNALQQRQFSCSIKLDLNAPTIYFGHRPWHNNELILAEMKGNLQLVEHAAKTFLEQNIQENYSQSIQLFSAAIIQFKRYHCKRFSTLSYLNIAEEYICFKQFNNSLQILQHVLTEFKSFSFHSLLRNVLLLIANCAYCCLNINEWIFAIAQILHYNISNPFNQNLESYLFENAQKYFSGQTQLPFPILPNFPFLEEDFNSFNQQWEQLLLNNKLSQNLFQLEMCQLNYYSFLNCKINLLPFNTIEYENNNYQLNNNTTTICSGDCLPIKVLLKNFSNISLNLNNCTIYLEQNSSINNNKSLITLNNFNIINNNLLNFKENISTTINLFPNQTIILLFILKIKIGKEFLQEYLRQQDRAQSPSSSSSNLKNIQLDLCVRNFTIRINNGCFIWEYNDKLTQKNDKFFNFIENPFIRVIPRQINLLIVCPFNKINLFTEESIEVGFSLKNNLEDCQDLNYVRILCQKVYCEEDQQQIKLKKLVLLLVQTIQDILLYQYLIKKLLLNWRKIKQFFF